MPQNCLHCQQPYRPPESLKKQEFCEACAAAYDAAFVKIHQFILDHDKPQGYSAKDIEWVMTANELPRRFVQKFFNESGSQKSLIEASRSTCSRCNKDLLPHERRYCTACSQTTLNLAREIDENRVDVAIPGRKTLKRRNANRSEHRYGLRRD